VTVAASIVYLDHAATTPIDPLVREAMLPFLDEAFGNPSSRHRPGQRAAEAVERARVDVARATGAKSADVLFTSGGTEANNLGVLGSARARTKRGKHVLVGPTEHACVRDSTQALLEEGFEVESLRLDGTGALDLDHLESSLREETVLVALMLVQNEFGSVYPVREAAKLVRARSPHAAFHVDAVQGFGKVETSIREMDADSIAISAHKIHGPKGTGALVTKEALPLRPLVFGGGQQGGRRPGTENVAGIVGFGLAARMADELLGGTRSSTARCRAVIAEAIDRIPGARVLVPGTPAQPMSPSILSAVFPGVPSEVRMNHLEELGVVVSAGSACHAKASHVSPALSAIGLTADDARCMLRFSFSRTTSEAEVHAAAEALEQVCRKLESAHR
jgi:cysteine desulfurase